MLNDPFLTSANKTISDNMRFVKNFQADASSTSSSNTPKASSSAPAPNPMELMMNYMNPMMMMMMFRMMDAIITKMEGGTPQAQAPTPYIPGVTTPPAGATPTPATPSIADNPAVSYLENIFSKKAEADPTATTIQLTDADVASVQSAVASGALNPTQVGQALMYELDKTPDKNVAAVGQLIGSLADSGDLNLAPFLQNDYIGKLAGSRRDALMQSVTKAGLTLQDGTPNARFVGFTLDALAKDGDDQTKAFLQQFLQTSYDATAADTTKPEGAVLSNLMALSGTTVDAQKKLVFLKPAATTTTTTDTTTAATTTTTTDTTTAAATTTTTDATTAASNTTRTADNNVTADAAAANASNNTTTATSDTSSTGTTVTQDIVV